MMRIQRMKWVAPVAIALMASGCLDNPLELLNPNQRTIEQFWATENDAISAMDAVYRSLGNDGLYGRNGYWIWARADAHMSRSPASGLLNLTRGIVTNLAYTTYGTRGVWDDPYQSIFRANQVIFNVAEMEDLDSGLREQIVAEAKFVRAIDHFELTIRFGNVPIITQLVEAGDQPEFSQQSAVYDQVISDAMDAASVLPWTWTGSDIGRATRGGALALAAEAHMMKNEWSAAVGILDQIVSSNQYTLLPNYEDLFTIPEGENSPEGLFEYQCGDAEAHRNGARGCTNPRLVGPSSGNGSSVGFNDSQPSQWGFEQFFVGDPSFSYPDSHDPRLNVTLYWMDPSVPGGKGPDVFGLPFLDRYSDTGPQGRPGFRDTEIDETFFWRKYQEHWKTTLTDFFNPINVKIYRLGGILMMQAEAKTETGDVAGAKVAIDRVRARVGLDPVPAGMSQSEMRDFLRSAQVREQMWEGNSRMTYLLRQGLFTKEYFTNTNPFMAALFENGKHDKLPIPQYEIDRNPNASQNPGW